MIYIGTLIIVLLLLYIIGLQKDLADKHYRTHEYIKSASNQLISIALDQNSLILRSGPEQPERGYYFITYKCSGYLHSDPGAVEGSAWFYGSMSWAVDKLKDHWHAEKVIITGRWAVTEEEYSEAQLAASKLAEDDINKLFGLED